jgi:hypothetical protein
MLFFLAPLFASALVATVITSMALWVAWTVGVVAEVLLVVVGVFALRPAWHDSYPH